MAWDTYSLRQQIIELQKRMEMQERDMRNVVHLCDMQQKAIDLLTDKVLNR